MCATCDNDTTCLTCKGDRAGEDCACPAGTYDDGASEFCVPCGTPGCSECSSPSGQCTACLGDRILTDAKECACADGKYDDGRSLNCVACDYKCATCSGSATSCLTCAGDRINQHCDCPAGKFDNGVVECVVPQCDITCASCDLNGCLTCAANRYGPLHYKCDCPEEDNGVSRLAPLNTPACSTCQHGVIDAYFSYDLSQILVDFGAQLALSDSKLEGTNALCKRVLNQAVID